MKAKWVSALTFTALVVLWVLPAGAQWSHDPNLNTPVCTAAFSQYFSGLVSDGAGGAITTWEDARSGAKDIYARRVDSTGTALWTVDGVAICTATGEQVFSRLASDGAGGAIITWLDPRSGPSQHIYAQRVDSSGTVLWTVDGIPVCTAASSRSNIEAVSDGAGGAIIVWKDDRSGTADIYAQRVDGSGTVLWTPNGEAVCTATGSQFGPDLVSDGSGGAIFTWWDSRFGAYDIFAQRIGGSGTVLWDVDGAPVCTAANNQIYPQLLGDGMGGAIIAWTDYRAGLSDIYVQQVDSSGAAFWTANGVAICTATNNQQSPQLVSDGAGGAIITWHDYRSGSNYDIYTRRVDGAGNALWTTDGEAVCTAANDQSGPILVSDSTGGAIITWTDNRSGIYDLYAQGVDGLGNARWAVDGVAVSIASNTQSAPRLISDDAGGAIVAWTDARSGSFYDIYAQQIERHGYLGGDPTPIITEVIDYPDDQGGVVVLSWAPGYLDEYPYQVVTHYSVWKRIPAGGAASPADDALSGWAHVEDITAYYWDEYASDAPTYGVFTGTGEIPLTEYKVVAQTGDQWVYWESAVASGYSVDNLAPGAPLDLTGMPSGMDALLNWTASGHLDEDLAFYRVHRSSVSGFTPDGTTLIGTAADTIYTDTNPGAGTWYFKVTGEDVHGNEGLPSNETSAATGPTSTIAAGLTCLPSSGTLPFGTTMTVTLDNLYTGQSRRISGRLDAALAGGQSYTSWRAGFTNVAAGGSFVTSWNQNLPALGTLVGSNVFSLVAEDVTPAPYNQPPYPPAGDTAGDACTVTGAAP